MLGLSVSSGKVCDGIDEALDVVQHSDAHRHQLKLQCEVSFRRRGRLCSMPSRPWIASSMRTQTCSTSSGAATQVRHFDADPVKRDLRMRLEITLSAASVATGDDEHHQDLWRPQSLRANHVLHPVHTSTPDGQAGRRPFVSTVRSRRLDTRTGSFPRMATPLIPSCRECPHAGLTSRPDVYTEAHVERARGDRRGVDLRSGRSGGGVCGDGPQVLRDGDRRPVSGMIDRDGGPGAAKSNSLAPQRRLRQLPLGVQGLPGVRFDHRQSTHRVKAFRRLSVPRKVQGPGHALWASAE